MRPPLTALFLVRNEADRLPAALASLAGWTEEVVVVDTGSADGTRELAREAGARVVEVPWEGWVTSRNRALAEPVHDWVLVLDADERVTGGLKAEVDALLDDPGSLGGARMPRLSHLWGRPVRHGTWWPDLKLRLGRRSARFRAEGGRVHETLAVDGEVATLAAPLLHVPYRDASDALRKAVLYARLAALDRRDRGRRGSAARLLVRPPLEFLRSYVLARGFLDGRAGLAAATFHTAYHFLREAFLFEHDRRQQGRRAGCGPTSRSPEPPRGTASGGRS